MKERVGKIITSTAAVLAALLLVFLLGRYGWRLGGFGACESAGISRVEVTDGQVELEGFYPGLSPKGFLGYYAEEADGTLYVGFKFSTVFGMFETGDFAVTIPTKGEIENVVIKTRKNEYEIWPGP
ncbi:MAG: hypothetical protein Q4A39_02125 [Eubacteriales bacterium]|nr:hypothetical protein [Eubacteriales bacterium]